MSILTKYYVFSVEDKQHAVKVCYREDGTWKTFVEIHRFIDGKEASISDLLKPVLQSNGQHH